MPKNTPYDSSYSIFLTKVLGIYVFLVAVGIPLITTNMYFNILRDKYYYYLVCTILMAVCVTGYFIITKKKEISLKKVWKSCTVADYALLLYLLIAVISTVTSNYLFESFWGNEGRYTGLFLTFWYVVSYFCVSRFWKFSGWHVNALLVAGMMVCLLGISDYFDLDVLGFKALMFSEQRGIFTSTIGNINTYTAYVGILTAISTVLFSTDNKFRSRLWHYCCMVISFFALIMGTSDNAYLSLGVLFAFLPLYLFKNARGIQRYFIVLASFLSVIKCVEWINHYFSGRVLGVESAFSMIISFRGTPYLLICLWGIVIFLNFIIRRKNEESERVVNTFRYIWLALLFLVAVFLLYAIYDCNILGNAERYEEVSSYLLFNDDWGTHRGYIWRNAMECFSRFSWWKKLVGFGPETFGILLLQQTKNNPYNELFDSAHNEYLQFLLTVGIAGLISYVIFVLSCIKRCFSYKTGRSFVVALAFGAICYSTQAFVNLNLPIVTPIFWLLLGMGTSRSLENNE